MKAILVSSVLLASSVTPAIAGPRTPASEVDPRVRSQLHRLEREEAGARAALQAALDRKRHARARWDAAVAGDHPVAAGTWARRYFDAKQEHRDAQLRWNHAAARVAALRFARR
jgi:hypothetical protein